MNKDLIIIDGVEYVRKGSIPTEQQILSEFKKRTLSLVQSRIVNDSTMEREIRENVWVICNLDGFTSSDHRTL